LRAALCEKVRGASWKGQAWTYSSRRATVREGLRGDELASFKTKLQVCALFVQ